MGIVFTLIHLFCGDILSPHPSPVETFCPHTPLQCLLVTCPTILCGNSLGAIGSWNQALGLKGGTHRESNRLSLFVSFQEISVASGGPIVPCGDTSFPHTPLPWRGHSMSRYVTTLHRAHGAAGASSLLLSGHEFYLG